MAVPVIMPKFEMSQDSATVVEWLKGEGDHVETGEPLLIVETDKVTMEVESPAAGTLAGVRGEPDEIVPVTEIIAYVLQAGEMLPSAGMPASPSATGTAMPSGPHSEAPSAVASAGAASPGTNGADWLVASPPSYQTAEIRATPAARRVARDRAIDLATVTGSGPRGRVQAADVEVYASDAEAAGAHAAVDAAAETVEVRPMDSLRLTIARRMAASHQATARVTLVTKADATDLVETRTRLKAAVSEVWGFAPGYNELLALIVGRALREFPYMNARLSADGGSIERLPRVNVGIAVDTERGLLVPVIHDADRKGLQEISSEFQTLVERARAGRSLPDDLRGGTFTVTNLGTYDVDAFTPIINLPEVAILGAGRIQPEPAVVPPLKGSRWPEPGIGNMGEIVVRQMWTLSLVFDHRLVDGAPAARFLQRLKQVVENPFLLIG